MQILLDQKGQLLAKIHQHCVLRYPAESRSAMIDQPRVIPSVIEVRHAKRLNGGSLSLATYQGKLQITVIVLDGLSRRY